MCLLLELEARDTGSIYQKAENYINTYIFILELGNITILSYIVILKCHDNRYRRDFFSIVISPYNIIVNIVVIVQFITLNHANFMSSS